MPETIPDLWPEKFGKLTELTPVAILKQQGMLLEQKTQNLVVGEVETTSENGQFWHHFRLRAPAIRFVHELLWVRHGIYPYPADIGLSDKPRDYICRASDASEFIAELRNILSSETSIRVVQALLAQTSE